jgi:ribosomal protein L7/L12
MESFAPLVWALIAITGVLLVFSGRRNLPEAQSRRLAAIERKLDLIMENLGIEEPEPDVNGEVLRELQAGRKIQAIKAYREATGVGLKEAKDEVEAVGRRYGLL